jgi:hypothetical protein
MKIYGINVQYGDKFHWSLMDDELFLEKSKADERTDELEKARQKDKLFCQLFHRYEVEELEVK